MATQLQLQHFAILTITQQYTATSIIIIVTTNNPCHLTSYFTEIEPRRYVTNRIVRGLAMPCIPNWSFVTDQTIEQQEPGDTLIHTFEKPGWLVCQTKWFTFRGTVASELSPSVTAIIKKHKAAPQYELACTSDPLLEYSIVISDGGGISIPFKPTSSYKINRVTVGFRRHPTRPPPDYAYIRIYQLLPDNCPIEPPLCQATLNINLPNDTDYFPHTVDFTPTPLTAGVAYGLATYYPTQCTPPRYCRIYHQQGENWNCPPDSQIAWAWDDALGYWYDAGPANQYFKTFKVP